MRKITCEKALESLDSEHYFKDQIWELQRSSRERLSAVIPLRCTKVIHLPILHPPRTHAGPMQRQTPNHVDTVCQCRGWARPRDENGSVNMGRQQGASLSPHAAWNKQKGRFRDFAEPNFVVSAQGLFQRFLGAAYGILFLAYEVPPARYKLCLLSIELQFWSRIFFFSSFSLSLPWI